MSILQEGSGERQGKKTVRERDSREDRSSFDQTWSRMTLSCFPAMAPIPPCLCMSRTMDCKICNAPWNAPIRCPRVLESADTTLMSDGIFLVSNWLSSLAKFREKFGVTCHTKYVFGVSVCLVTIVRFFELFLKRYMFGGRQT